MMMGLMAAVGSVVARLEMHINVYHARNMFMLSVVNQKKAAKKDMDKE